MTIKNVKHVELNISIATVFLNTQILKITEYKCLCCNKNYQQGFDKKLKEHFFNTYNFSNHNNNKFMLFLRKGVYLYEYMDDLEKFNETSLPEEIFTVT